MQQEIKELGELIQDSQKILLINHIRMDGDAWGSLGGLYLILKDMGKDVRAVNDAPVPPILDFLGHSEIIEPDLDATSFNPDICISLDASGTERLGESYIKWKPVFDSKPFVVLDHHINNPGFGDLNIIDTDASSVCELLTRIITELKLEKYVTQKAATFLYTGLQTDTNMYATTNTTPDTLRAGAKLMELGADYNLPIQKCFREKTPDQIRALQLAYQNIQLSDNGNISYCIITSTDLESHKMSLPELGSNLKGFINETLINIEGVKIAFLLTPLQSGEVKCSMRSIKGYDVNAIAQEFGGGGHIQAAGFESSKSSREIEKEILVAIKKGL